MLKRKKETTCLHFTKLKKTLGHDWQDYEITRLQITRLLGLLGEKKKLDYRLQDYEKKNTTGVGGEVGQFGKTECPLGKVLFYG